jgi:outer membrane protein assembly factor BamC
MIKRSALFVLPLALPVTLLTLSGCSSFSLDRKVDYRSAQPAPSLELPPDVKSPVFENHYVIPEIGSNVGAARNTIGVPITEQRADTPSTVLQNQQGNIATLVKSGQQRWIVVHLPADQVWNTTKEFWAQTGFTIKEDHPEIGIMETDWAENRAKIPQDIIRRTIGRVLDMLYSTAERDLFKTRLEHGSSPDTTEIYISHKGMVEVADNPTDARIYKWQPRPSDPDLEAEMLQRLVLKFNHPSLSEENNKTKDKGNTEAGIPVKEEQEHAHLIKQDNHLSLKVDDRYESTWQRTSLALEHLGFTLEDRNRKEGFFLLRYGSDAEPQKKNWTDKLSFWKADPKTKTANYRLHLSPEGSGTQITVETPDAQPANVRVAEPILSLLQAQLR